DLTVEDVLNIITKVADRKIKYSVTGFAVVLSAQSDEPPTLHTRYFKVDTNTFPPVLAWLSQVKNPAPGIPIGATVIPNLQSWFKLLGVDLAAPGKAIFFKDSMGLLMVRATMEDLAMIEKAMQSLNAPPATDATPSAERKAVEKPASATDRVVPPPVTDPKTNDALHTRFFRIDPNTFQQGLSSLVAFDFKTGRTNRVFGKTANSNELVTALQSFFKQAGADLSGEGKSVFFNDRVGTLMVRATVEELNLVEKAVQLLNMNPPQVTIRVKVLEVEKRPGTSTLDWFSGVVRTNDLAAKESTMAGKNSAQSPQFTGVLTDEQFRRVLKTLEQ